MKAIALLVLSLFSVAAFCQRKEPSAAVGNNLKSVAKAGAAAVPKKDSVTAETPLINYKDIAEFDAFLEDKLRVRNKKIIIVADYDAVMGWLNQRINQKVKEYYSRNTLP